MWIQIVIAIIAVISFMGSIGEKDGEKSKQYNYTCIAAVLALAVTFVFKYGG